MHPAAGYLKIKIVVLAAIFIVAVGCVVLATRALAPRPAGPAETRRPHATKTFTAAAKTKRVYPVEKKEAIKSLLHPATVEVSRPSTIRLGDDIPISLTIKPDRTGRIKAAFPMPGDLLAEVRSNVSGENVVSVYETQVSDSVATKLFGAGSDAPIPAHEGENPLLVPDEGVAWNWRLPVTEPGNTALEFEMVAQVQVGANAESWPIGTLDLSVPIVPTWFQWLGYYFGEAGSLWNWLVGLATGIVAVTGMVPIVNKWLPHRAARQSAADINMVN